MELIFQIVHDLRYILLLWCPACYACRLLSIRGFHSTRYIAQSAMRLSRVPTCNNQHLILRAWHALTNMRGVKRMDGLYATTKLAAKQAVVLSPHRIICCFVSVIAIVPRIITAAAEARRSKGLIDIRHVEISVCFVLDHLQLASDPSA